MSKLSDWEIVGNKPLGKGGQSTVYLVRGVERTASLNAALGRLCTLGAPLPDLVRAQHLAEQIKESIREDRPKELAALKKFTPRETLGPQAEASALARLKNEIEMLSEQQTGFVPMLASNLKERWIVTQYCPNGTLEDNLGKYRGDVLGSLKALFPIIMAVAEIHKRDIVHRDIKPQNIFIGEKGELLLGDFGLVFFPNQADRITRMGESVGPRDFIPPWLSIADHPTEVTTKCDVYMLGKVLWCMVAGRPKLHREDHHHATLDLTNMFKENPHMHIVNTILDKTVVTEERDCWSSLDLASMVFTFIKILDQGGQLLTEGVPRPCRVCGHGEYVLQMTHPQKDNAVTSFQFYRPEGASGVQTGGFQAFAWACNYCGNVQFFRTNYNF